MGKTVESYRTMLKLKSTGGTALGKLRRPDREAFDELMDMFRSYASGSSIATKPIIFETMIMSILIAQRNRIQKLEHQLKEALQKSGETTHG